MPPSMSPCFRGVLKGHSKITPGCRMLRLLSRLVAAKIATVLLTGDKDPNTHQTHAGYILNVPHFSNVIALCPKCGRSIKLGTLRSHDWVHSKSDQHFSQEQIKTTFMGTFSINPTFAHWAHWSHLLSVLPMYPAYAWWIFGSLSPVGRGHVMPGTAPRGRRKGVVGVAT